MRKITYKIRHKKIIWNIQAKDDYANVFHKLLIVIRIEREQMWQSWFI